MELGIVEEKVYLLREQLSMEQAKERAWDAKGDVFGGLNKFIFRPKGEDVQITLSQKRYEPFWHVVSRSEYIYDSRRKFQVPVSSLMVERVTLEGLESDFPVEKQNFTVRGVEHFREETSKEVFVDAATGEPRDFKSYLQYAREEINFAEFDPGEAIVVPPEIRASYVVRQVLGETMKAVQADVIHKEEVEVTTIDLYLKPVYAFEYFWAAKDKRAVVEFDGLTGEMRTGGKAIHEELGRILTPEVLFDVGTDAVDLLLPGGGIALKVGRAVVARQRQQQDGNDKR
jgi:hypothetical protein